MNQVENLFPDPDNELAIAAKKAGNIIFAQSFKPQGKKKEPVKKRTEVMEKRLKLLEERNLFRTWILFNILLYLIFMILKPLLILLSKIQLEYTFFNQTQILMDSKKISFSGSL